MEQLGLTRGGQVALILTIGACIAAFMAASKPHKVKAAHHEPAGQQDAEAEPTPCATRD